MIQSQALKLVGITPPATIVDNASYTTTAVDTVGFAHCKIVIYLGATDIAMAALKVQESDASDMSGAVDISGADFSVSPATLPSSTDDNKFVAVDIDLRGRKRYLDLVATAGDGSTGTYLAAFAILSRASETPSTATERGFAQELYV